MSNILDTYSDLQVATGRSLHCQVENHVRTKFATFILYAIDIFEIYDYFFI